MKNPTPMAITRKMAVYFGSRFLSLANNIDIALQIMNPTIKGLGKFPAIAPSHNPPAASRNRASTKFAPMGADPRISHHQLQILVADPGSF
jgi:hypothetical protein